MKRILIALSMLAALVSCTNQNPKEYKVVGYFLPRGIDHPEQMNWDITHVNLAFATVNADGSLNEERVTRTNEAIRDIAAQHGVKRLVSLGGGGPKSEQDAFAAAVVGKESRAALIQNTLNLVEKLELDGIDLDYEAWSGYDEEYLSQITEGLEEVFVTLKKQLKGKDLTSAVGVEPLERGYYTRKTLRSMSFVNVMCYDLTGPWTSHGGPHSPFEFAVRGIDAAIAAGAKPSSVVLGVPFYGYGFPEGKGGENVYHLRYWQIVSMYPGAEMQDCVNGELFYDGIPTMEKKCQYVMDHNLGGIMFWDMSQDTNDELSLTRTINRVFGR